MLGTHSSGEKMSQDCSSRVGKNTHFAIPAALAYRQSRFCFKAAVRQRIWIVSGPDLPSLQNMLISDSHQIASDKQSYPSTFCRHRVVRYFE
jgi:hypothetical protein